MRNRIHAVALPSEIGDFADEVRRVIGAAAAGDVEEMGATGSVAWMFTRQGQIVIDANGRDPDEVGL